VADNDDLGDVRNATRDRGRRGATVVVVVAAIVVVVPMPSLALGATTFAMAVAPWCSR